MFIVSIVEITAVMLETWSRYIAEKIPVESITNRMMEKNREIIIANTVEIIAVRFGA